MPYKNVKVSKLARDVSIERCGNGYVVRPEYAGVSYEEKNEYNEVYTSLADALKAAGKALDKGITSEEEKWVDEAPVRRAKGY